MKQVFSWMGGWLNVEDIEAEEGKDTDWEFESERDKELEKENQYEE